MVGQVGAQDNIIAAEKAAQILKSISIPACPTVAAALLQEARGNDVDLHRVQRLISGDVGLAAAMLKTANSPFFALRRQVNTVQDAVMVLGLKNVISIVLGLSVKKSLTPKGVSMDRFWDRSNFHAVASSLLARATRTVPADDAYSFGLFHDCGIPILMQRFPGYKDTLVEANAARRSPLEVENERHNTDHAVVGALLAKNWHLPALVANAIGSHHDFDKLDMAASVEVRQEASLAAISLLADHMIARFLGVADEAEWFVHGEPVLEFLALNVDDIADLEDEISPQLAEVRASRG